MDRISDLTLGRLIEQAVDDAAADSRDRTEFAETVGSSVRALLRRIEQTEEPVHDDDTLTDAEMDQLREKMMSEVERLIAEVGLGEKPDYIPSPGDPCPKCGREMSGAVGGGVNSDGVWAAIVGYCEDCGPVTSMEGLEGIEVADGEEQAALIFQNAALESLRPDCVDAARRYALALFRDVMEAFRQELGYSIERMAEVLEMPPNGYDYWRNGGAVPPAMYLNLAKLMTANRKAHKAAILGVAGLDYETYMLTMQGLMVGALDS